MSMVSTPRPSLSGDEVDLVEVYRIIWQEKLVLAIVGLIPVLVAVLLTLSQPKQYVAEATIVPRPQRSEAVDVLSAGIAAQFGPAASMLNELTPYRPTDLVTLLKSRTLAEQVISKHPEVSQLFLEADQGELAASLASSLVVRSVPETSALGIRVFAREPGAAVTLANAYVQELQEALDRLTQENAGRKLRAIEQHLAKMKADRAERNTTLNPQEVAARNAVYQVLMQQQEAAQFEMTQRFSHFLPLDMASHGERYTAPSMMLLIPIGILVGATVGVMAAFISHRIRVWKR